MKIKEKVWLKKFSEKEFSLIENIFMENSPYSKDSWGEIKYPKMVKKHGQFVHMESDYADNSVGVSPKQLKDLFNEKGEEKALDFLSEVLPILNSMAKSNLLNSKIEDGFVNWEITWAELILYLGSKNKNFYQSLGLFYIEYLKIEHVELFNPIDAEVLIAFGKGKLSKSDFEEAVANGSITDSVTTLKLEHFDFERMLDVYRSNWEKAGKYVPKSKYLLRVNPDNFNAKQLVQIERFYGTKKFNELSKSDEENAALIIDNFGSNLEAIPTKLVLNGNFMLSFGSKTVSDHRTFIRKVSTVVNNLTELRTFLNVLNMYPALEGYVNKKEEISQKEYLFLLYLMNIILDAPKSSLKSLCSMPPMAFKMFYRNDPANELGGLRNIITLSSLFEKNKHKKTTIPLIKGKIGNYTYEIIDKNNPEGLILGYATDCCQVLGGTGEMCLIKGYEEEASAFFVIRKGDQIYGQSWIWEKTAKGKKAFAFDSVEVLLDRVNGCSSNVVQCYIDAAEKLKDHYDIIIASADGSVLPDGLKKIGKPIVFDYRKSTVNYLTENGLKCPFPGVYSDIDRTEKGIFLIKDSSNKEGNKNG